MSHIDDLFEGSSKLSMSNTGGDYTDVGLYKVRIKDLFVKASTDPAKEGVLMFIVEYTFTESSNPKHVVGSSGSSAWKVKPDPYKFGVQDVKKLFFSVLSVLDPSNPADHVLVELLQKAALDPGSPAVATLKAAPYGIDDAKGMLVGQIVSLEVKPPKRNKAGTGEYSPRVWSSVPG